MQFLPKAIAAKAGIRVKDPFPCKQNRRGLWELISFKPSCCCRESYGRWPQTEENWRFERNLLFEVNSSLNLRQELAKKSSGYCVEFSSRPPSSANCKSYEQSRNGKILTLQNARCAHTTRKERRREWRLVCVNWTMIAVILRTRFRRHRKSFC